MEIDGLVSEIQKLGYELDHAESKQCGSGVYTLVKEARDKMRDALKAIKEENETSREFAGVEVINKTVDEMSGDELSEALGMRNRPKTTVSLRHGNGDVDLYVNGNRVKVPKVDAYRHFGEESEKVDLEEMIKTFAEDKCRMLICGEERLDERQISELASRLRPYWEEIDDVLGIE